MAAVSLFWDTNMAAVMSCENTLLGLKWLEHTTLQPHGWSPSTQLLLGQLVFRPSLQAPAQPGTTFLSLCFIHMVCVTNEQF